MLHHYSRGDGTLFTCPNRIVYLPCALDTAAVGELWQGLLVASDSLIGMLDVITKNFDPTLESLPDFVAIFFDASTPDQEPGPRNIRVALRGDISLTIANANHEEKSFTGAQATMWREESVQDVVTLGVGDLQGATVPLMYGVAYSGGFLWSGVDTSLELPEAAGAVAHVAVSNLPDLGATLTELPEEWFESQPPQSTAPLLAAPVIATPDHIPVASPAPNRVEPKTAVMSTPYYGCVQFSHGQEVDLGAPIVVGRKPSIAGSGAQPGAFLVTVPSPSKDISRNHLGIHLEQGFVIATDLGSVNGTLLKRGGQPDRKLNPREGTLILDGDILDLGDNAILSFHGIA